MTTVHHIDDYGADPKGVTPSDAAFDAAVDAASTGDCVALTNGTYYFTKSHDIRKALVIRGTGGVIESDLHAGHGYHDDYPRESASDGTQIESIQPIIAFRGKRGERVGLTTTVQESTDRVRVSDSTPFTVGDGILLCNENLDTERKVGTADNRSRTYEPTVSTVRAVDDDIVFLDIPARYDYPADENHHAYPLAFLDGANFIDCHFRNRSEPYWDAERGKVMGGFRHAMLHQYCRKPVVRDCSVHGYDTKMWASVDVLGAHVVNPRAEAPLNVNGSHGEPLYILGSTDIAIYNPVIRGARRAIDVRAGCKDVNVYNPDITGVTFLGLSYHHGYGKHVRGNLNVYGGRVYCRPTDPLVDDHGGDADRRWELQRGDGMCGTPANGRVTVSGTSFIVRRHGATCHGSGTVIRGCEFKTVPRGSGTNEPVLAISGENITIRNTVVQANPHGADHTAAVRVNDGCNVKVDVQVMGEFAGTPVVIDGGERLRLHVRSAATGGDCGVRIDGPVSDLTLSGDVYNDGPGVVVESTADAQNVRIQEIIHCGTGPTVRVASDAAVSDLRLSEVDSIHGGAVDLSGGFVDGLQIRDWAVNDINRIHPDQHNDPRTVIGNTLNNYETDG